MQFDPEDLRRHYASLSDGALRDLDRSELTDVARKCFDEEVARRDLAPRQAETEPFENGEEPEWLEDASCACSYTSFPGSSAAADAANAREVLEEAGIPCHISTHELEPEPPPDDSPVLRYEYQVMVPGALNLQATSVLDRDIFNPDLEANWVAHFQTLSDDELRALTPEVICLGLQDRIMRLQRAYAAELARRGFEEPEPEADSE